MTVEILDVSETTEDVTGGATELELGPTKELLDTST